MWIFGLRHGIKTMLEFFAKQVVDALGNASTEMNNVATAVSKQYKVVEEHGKFVNTVFDELKKITEQLTKQNTYLKGREEAASKVIELLGNLEKRMNGYSFTAVECQELVGELRVMRLLLDKNGEFKDLDKPRRKPEDILK